MLNDNFEFGKSGPSYSLISLVNNMLLLTVLNRSALKGKGGQWTVGNLDKYLKSPADYAPGKKMLRSYLLYR